MYGSSFFAASDLDAWLAAKKSEAEEALQREGVPPDWALDEALRQGRVHPLELHRDEAEFDVAGSREGVAVRLRLPFEGEPRLFDLRPGSAPDRTVAGEVLDRNGDGHVIQLRHTFPLGSPAEKIREWAKSQVDLLERWVAQVNKQVKEHNDSLPEHTHRLVEQRRARQEDVDRLRGELSGRGV
jgi:hypothetical protein